MPPACSRRAPAAARASCLLPLVLSLLVVTACGAATSATKDDGTIATRVKIALLNDPQVGALRIDARSFQGVITLAGTVTSQADVDAAIAVARKTRDVRDVKSELKVVP